MGARVLCASLTIFTICASSVAAPTRSAFITRLPVPLIVPPTTLSPAVFSTGMGSPLTIDSSTELRPSSHQAIDGYFFAWADAQKVTNGNLAERDIGLAPVGGDAARRFRGEAEQRLDRAAGLAASSQLQHLAQQDQNGDDSGRLKIKAEVSGGIAERRRKEAGRDHGRHAVEIGSAAANRNEREHIQAAMNNRSPATLKERPSAPQHHRRCQGEFHPPQQPACIRCCRGWPGKTSETMTASRGSVSTAPIHRRRVMLANSGLAALAVTVRGSSAMPQIGQVPGPSRTICGCMGQVYSMCSVAEEGSIGSSAIPHLGQAPGFAESTSGCMGQVYCADARGRGGGPMDTNGAACEPSYLPGSSLELCPASLGTEVPGASCMLDGCCGFFRQHLHAAYRIDLCQLNVCHALTCLLVRALSSSEDSPTLC